MTRFAPALAGLLFLTACPAPEECEDDSTATDDTEVTDTQDTGDTGEADPCADAADGTWSYDNIDCWAEVQTGSTCDGDQQSPVDITGATAGTPPTPQINPALTNNTLTRSGGVLDIAVAPGAFLTWGTLESGYLRDATLQGVGLRAPAEHTLDGVAAPLELQFRHLDIWGGTWVNLSVSVVEGAENETLKPFVDNLPADGQSYTGDALSLYALLPSDRAYVTYAGSQTTPPCTENVEWLVMTNTIEASADQIAALEAVLGGARPVQDLNGRTLTASQ